MDIPETEYAKKFNFPPFLPEIWRIKEKSVIGVGWIDTSADLSLIVNIS